MLRHRPAARILVSILIVISACIGCSKSDPIDAASIDANKAVVSAYLAAIGTPAFGSVADNLHASNHELTRHEFEVLRYNADDPELSKLTDPLQLAISDRKNTITRILAEGDRVAATYRATGTHSGNLFGIPATGRTVEFEAAAMFRLKDGKIIESWFLAEEAGLLRQLNARLPARVDGKINLPPIIDDTRTYDEALVEHLANPEDTPEWRHRRLLLAYKSLPENRPADYTFEGRPYTGLVRGGIDVIKYRGEELGIEGGHGQSMSGRLDRISDVVAEGDLAMMRFRLTAQNTGPLYGIPAGGGPLNDWEVGFARFEGDAWVEAWWMKDELGYLLSIGNQEALDFLVGSAYEFPTIPDTQMAIVQDGNGGPDVLKHQSIAVLAPGEGEILVKVVATAINPIDRRFREGMGRPPGPGSRPPGAGRPPGGGGPAGRPPGANRGMEPAGVPGGDLAGIVVKLGEGVTSLNIGDAVFSKLPLGKSTVEGLNGAYSEYVITRADHTNLKPADQTFAEAAGLGTVGVTALRTIRHADVTAGQRVFINGIGGGIGSSAAQFAKERGAYVLGTASGRHHEHLKSVGVDEVINYREVQFDEVIDEPVDVVIETVGSATANQALSILKPGGKLVSIVGPADPAQCTEKQLDCSRIGGEFGWPNTEMLAEVARLAREGHYRLNVDETFPLQEAAAAQDRNFNVGTSGKIVLIVDAGLANQK